MYDILTFRSYADPEGQPFSWLNINYSNVPGSIGNVQPAMKQGWITAGEQARSNTSPSPLLSLGVNASKEPLGFWVEERGGVLEGRRSYLFCNLQKRSHVSKFLLEIFNDIIAIHNFFKGNGACWRWSMCFHFVKEEIATRRGVMVFQGLQQPDQFYSS